MTGMASRSGVLIALCVATVHVGTIQADMMPVSTWDAGPLIQTSVAAPRSSADSWSAFDDSRRADLGLLPTKWPLEVQDDGRQPDGVRAVQLKSDGQNSLGLCLYTLLSLGLCRSVPLARRLSFGCVPQWYHEGGPVRVGECLAISPDRGCAATVCYFLQPDFTAEDPIPQLRFDEVRCLWRRSQFTLIVLAPRAPPISSRRLSAA